MSSLKFDHVLVMGYGAPARREELNPYLDRFARVLGIPAPRLEEVRRRYEAIGGFSPYPEQVARFVRNLAVKLREKGILLPVFSGMRNWRPYLRDTVIRMKHEKFRKGLAIVLAPHRSEASFGRYEEGLERAQALEDAYIEYVYLGPWHDHPRFIEAHSDEIRRVLTDLDAASWDQARLVFSAHSIPLKMAEISRYEDEVGISSSRVAEAVSCRDWSVAFQSRSGSPDEAWLGPDVLSAVRRLGENGRKQVLFVPIGFLCDNAEILYDLDIEAKKAAESKGIGYARTGTVLNHPGVIEMFAQLVEGHL